MLGVGISLWQRRVNLDAAIRALFAAGEQGAWYDPSDWSTLYQDSAGTTPVTAVGQPVGLVLDKRLGLARGPEKLTNGDFSNGAASWSVIGVDATHIVTFAGGTARYQSDTTSPILNLTQSGVLTSGKTYEVIVVTSAWVSGSLKFDGANGANTVAAAVGTARVIFTANGPDLTIYRNSANVDVTIDSVSVRELPGNHATQATATARPLYQSGPTRIHYDGVDDVLNTTFAASLGANCTIARSVPSVGAQILTAQTIGTSYADSTDHCGLIIINRALTANETANVTAYLKQKAGV